MKVCLLQTKNNTNKDISHERFFASIKAKFQNNKKKKTPAKPPQKKTAPRHHWQLCCHDDVDNAAPICAAWYLCCHNQPKVKEPKTSARNFFFFRFFFSITTKSNDGCWVVWVPPRGGHMWPFVAQKRAFNPSREACGASFSLGLLFLRLERQSVENKVENWFDHANIWAENINAIGTVEENFKKNYNKKIFHKI